jgi:hypothetical protein
MVTVPVGRSVLDNALKTLMEIYRFQSEAGLIDCIISPRDAPGVKQIIKNYNYRLRFQSLYSSHDRAAGCILRDAYTIRDFIRMLETAWKGRDKVNARDNHLRDFFSMAARHQMLLRDEDIRNLNFSDCFSTQISNQNHGSQPVSMFVFAITRGKTNVRNNFWYAGAIRHKDVRRCTFSAFAFYLFGLWQVHTID